MRFKPFDRMQDHIETQKDISDAAYFNSLMYFGEMLTKFTVAAMVSAVDEGRDRHQYRLKHRLVKADGIGEWSQVLDEILTGVPAQHLFEGIKSNGNETNQLTKRTKPDEWQHKSVTLLFECLKIAEPDVEPLPKKIQGKSWFGIFAMFRNKTRGHGAPSGGQLSSMCPDLHDSITTFADNFRLYQRPWAYLAQTLKRKYYIVRWTEEAGNLNILKTREGKQYSFREGVYIHFGDEITRESLRITELILSDVDATDFFLPNGGWNGKRYKMLSYITSKTCEADAKNYLTPITDLPPSETEGLSDVEEVGGTILNMPPKQDEYISRQTPEENLYREIVEDNQHRIITLIGRGGIGKTWLTLEVLDRIAKEGIFDAILWFSARDIDLLPDSAKQVKPRILTEKHIANEFKNLIGGYLRSYEEINNDNFDSVKFLQSNMLKSEFGKILFVFDNFETVSSPIELFTWIDHYLRLPNKALITTRFREFRGDYPVELEGMSIEECKQLIDATASRLQIKHLITSDYEDELYDVSDGHPYVVKILLGEVRRTGRTGKVERILANYDDVLNTLFERTYTRLPLVAQRVFLTLCSWKSLVAETAIQAVLLRPENEMTDISEAIDDLNNSSLIEKSESKSDNELYWTVPLVARQFGLRKLETNSMQIAIKADTDLLRFFGATQETDMKHGMQPRINKLFNEIETRVLKSASVDDFLPIIESVAGRYPHTWLRLADLYLKIQEPSKFESTLKRYIESSRDNEEKRKAWQKLANFYQRGTKYADELFARIQLAQLPDTDYETISEAVNRFNNIVRLRQPEFTFEEGEKKRIVQLLIRLMETRRQEADATDFSRLGWLYMHNNQPDKAEETALRGLQLDENNHHCNSLLDRIRNGR